MRRLTILLACLIAALAASAAPAQAILQSKNVTLETKLPEAVGAISARFSADGQHMYVAAAKGLHIYDISEPANPQRAGFLPLPHFENEDVDVDQDRKWVIITNDPSFTLTGMLYVIDVSNPSLPMLLSATNTFRLDKYMTTDDPAQTFNGHISNCIQRCQYLWTTGSNEGIAVYDLKTDTPKFAGKFEMPSPKGRGEARSTPDEPLPPGFTHDVYVDRSGIGWITGEDGTFGYDTTGDPVKPKLMYRSDEDLINSTNDGPDEPESANAYPLDFLHHNSIRTSIQANPRAVSPASSPQVQAQVPTTGTPPAKAKPRKLTGCARFRTARVRARCQRTAALARKRCKRQRTARKRAACLRKVTKLYGPAPKPKKKAKPKAKKRFTPRTTAGGLGDVLAVTEEDYTRPGCQGQGSLQTWQISDERNSDGSTKLKMLDMWTTELNELSNAEGRSPATGNCSAHWFDEDKGLLAQGWYDQGVRFMDITDPRNIRQIGYYATTGTFWGAYYAPSDPKREIVYGLDTAGGIDVIRIDRSKAPSAMRTRTVPATDVRAQLSRTKSVAVKSPTWGFACAIVKI